jgi:hypothetical protein
MKEHNRVQKEEQVLGGVQRFWPTYATPFSGLY